ncbi:hypothetical protein FB451DRAFT_1565963 [Mycena latifolia]|nr:hypothetical protein FB451DRAFT_1565963 [Mycena latifolia]
MHFGSGIAECYKGGKEISPPPSKQPCSSPAPCFHSPRSCSPRPTYRAPPARRRVSPNAGAASSATARARLTPRRGACRSSTSASACGSGRPRASRAARGVRSFVSIHSYATPRQADPPTRCRSCEVEVGIMVGVGGRAGIVSFRYRTCSYADQRVEWINRTVG